MAEFIVAIELGSTKITGIAGRKNLDGSISVLSVVKEDASQCIRKGVVYNIDKTVQSLTNRRHHRFARNGEPTHGQEPHNELSRSGDFGSSHARI